MKITEDMIRNKAYELWEASGKPPGTANKDWFAAQALLFGTTEGTASVSNRSTRNGLRQLTAVQPS